MKKFIIIIKENILFLIGNFFLSFFISFYLNQYFVESYFIGVLIFLLLISSSWIKNVYELEHKNIFYIISLSYIFSFPALIVAILINNKLTYEVYFHSYEPMSWLFLMTFSIISYLLLLFLIHAMMLILVFALRYLSKGGNARCLNKIKVIFGNKSRKFIFIFIIILCLSYILKVRIGFEELGGVYYRIDDKIYALESNGGKGMFNRDRKEIEGADIDSFESLGPVSAMDKNHQYIRDKILIQKNKPEEELEVEKEKQAYSKAILFIAMQEGFWCIQKGGNILVPKDPFEGGGEICSVNIEVEGETPTWKPVDKADSKNFNEEKYSYGIVNNNLISIVQGDSTIVCCRMDMGACGDANFCDIGNKK